MPRTPFQEETSEMLKWLNQNRRMLLDLYRKQYDEQITFTWREDSLTSN